MATIDRLKKKRSKLLEQLDQVEVEIAALAGMTQAEIPGLPPSTPKQRAPSRAEEDFAEFQATRRGRLARLGVDVVPDRHYQPAFINARMSSLRSTCRDDDELFAVFSEFCRDDWAAGLTPPFPFQALASEKVFARLLDAVRAEVR